MSRARLRPARPPSRWLTAVLAAALVVTGFATLMIRLGITQEGYRLSELRGEVARLQESNRALKLQVAEYSSHQRLRALAAKFNMGPPARGQVVVVP